MLAAAPAARAAVLGAGPGQTFPTLAAAVAAARPGDTVRLAAGEFFECAVLTQPGLVLEGAGPDTVITDRTCEGKALLIARADGITIRNLTLARARVPDRNGAGVRLEANDLRLEGVRFSNDEVGLLAGGPAGGAVELIDCAFTGGGVAEENPSYAVLVGAAARLRVSNSTFENVKGGQISSAAAMTELNGNRVAVGATSGPGFAVRANGRLLARDNAFLLGPAAPPRAAAILLEGPGGALENNRMENATGAPAVLLLDWSDGDVRLSNNHLAPGDAERSTAGRWRHEVGEAARGLKRELRGAAGGAKRTLQNWLGR